MKRIALLLCLCMVLALGAGCVKAPTQAELASADYGAYPDNYEQIVKDAVKTALFDPYSAQYEFDGTPDKKFFAKPFQSPVYGWGGFVSINAKNRFGAYTGLKKYAYIIKNGKLVVFEENFRTQ